MKNLVKAKLHGRQSEFTQLQGTCNPNLFVSRRRRRVARHSSWANPIRSVTWANVTGAAGPPLTLLQHVGGCAHGQHVQRPGRTVGFSRGIRVNPNPSPLTRVPGGGGAWRCAPTGRRGERQARGARSASGATGDRSKAALSSRERRFAAGGKEVTYIYKSYTYTHISMLLCYIYLSIYLSISISIYIYIYKYIYIYVCVCVCVNIYIYIYMYIYIYIYIYIFIAAGDGSKAALSWRERCLTAGGAEVYIYIYIYICVCICIFIYMYIYLSLHMYIYSGWRRICRYSIVRRKMLRSWLPGGNIYVYMYVYIYIHKYIYIYRLLYRQEKDASQLAARR